MPQDTNKRQDKEKQGSPFLPIRFLRFGAKTRALGIIATLFADPLAGAALLVPLIIFLLALPFMLGAAPAAPGAPGVPGAPTQPLITSPTLPIGAPIIGPDKQHACVVSDTFIPFPESYSAIKESQYSYVCGHHRPIFNAIDTGVFSEGGSPVRAIVNGRVENITNPVGGPALWLVGDDGINYYYAHLRREGLVVGRVTVGQVIGYIASAKEAYAKNNGVAHVHFSAGTPGNKHTFDDPANIPAGPLLDNWCGNNVCEGKPNRPF